jgi:hypothetical protein
MITAPVRMPKNKEEITSFNKRAIKIATKGGSMDIHKGIIF